MNTSKLRELYQNDYPNVNEYCITPLERLHRLAILAIKPLATADMLDWAAVWRSWWRRQVGVPCFEYRGAADELLAYTLDRRAQALKETFHIHLFESAFDADYRDSTPFKVALSQNLETYGRLTCRLDAMNHHAVHRPIGGDGLGDADHDE